MLVPIVLALLVAYAHSTAQARATQQPLVSAEQSSPEKPWPPAGVVRAVAGSGVTTPRLIEETKPSYTAEALRARVQGSIKLEAIVQTDGTVGEVRVVHSLDKKYGLDEEAVRALKQWRFAPGKKDDIAVPVIVEVEMTFATGAGLPKKK